MGLFRPEQNLAAPWLKWLAWSLLALIGTCAATRAEESQDLAASPFLIAPRLLEAGDYNESWNYVVLFEDGTLVGIQLLITNMGPGSHRGLVIASVKKDDGRTTILKNGRSRSEWTVSPEGTSLKLAGHEFSTTKNGLSLRIANGSGELELELSPLSPPVPIVTRPLPDSPNLLFSYSAPVPLYAARGRFRHGPATGGIGDDEPWQTLKRGRGYLVHHWGTYGIDGIADGWFRLMPLDDAQFSTPLLWWFGPNGNGSSDQFAIVTQDAKPRLADRLKIEIVETYLLNRGRRTFVAPRRLKISAEGSGFAVHGEIELRRELQRLDTRGLLTMMERLFVPKRMSPIIVRHLAHYSLTLHEGDLRTRLEGNAIAEYISIRPRR